MKQVSSLAWMIIVHVETGGHVCINSLPSDVNGLLDRSPSVHLFLAKGLSVGFGLVFTDSLFLFSFSLLSSENMQTQIRWQTQKHYLEWSALMIKLNFCWLWLARSLPTKSYWAELSYFFFLSARQNEVDRLKLYFCYSALLMYFLILRDFKKHL